MHKVAGAASAEGLSLSEVTAEARVAAASLATVNVISKLAALPGAAASVRLPPGHVEVGSGIHGEPGARVQQTASANSLVAVALARICDNEHIAFPPGQRVVLLVNGMGGTPPGELAIIVGSALAWLKASGRLVLRVFSGTMMTSLGACGFSITLLRVGEGEAASRLLSRIDAPTTAPAWPRSCGFPDVQTNMIAETAPAVLVAAPHPPRSARGLAVERALRAAALEITAAEAQLDAADAVCGDGDCGRTLAAGARALLDDLLSYNTESIPALFGGLAASTRRAVGGTSGVLLDILWSAAEARAAAVSGELTVPEWSVLMLGSLTAGVAAVQTYGGAAPGMRTMLDAMLPALAAARAVLEQQGAERGWEAAAAAASAAALGAKATLDMVPAAGRASYRSDAGAQLRFTPDPGATAVSLALAAFAARSVPSSHIE